MALFDKGSPERVVEALLLLCKNALEDIDTGGLAFLLLLASQEKTGDQYQSLVDIYRAFRQHLWDENEAKLRRDLLKLRDKKLVNMEKRVLTNGGRKKLDELLTTVNKTIERLTERERKQAAQMLEKVAKPE